MSINRTDKTSGMDDMGDEQFAAMYCKASTYFPKPLNNTERKKVSFNHSLIDLSIPDSLYTTHTNYSF